MSGGGIGNVLSTGASLAAGQSPLGAFGSALGSQLLSGGGGGGPGAPAGGIGGIGRQNQTQLVGPMAGVNPASPAYNIMMQQQQPRPQVLPQVTPQVQQPAPQAVPPAYQNYMQGIVGNPQLGGMGISGVTGGMPAQGMGTPTTYLPPPTTQTEAINRLGGMGIAGVRQLPFQGGMGIGGIGQVQQALGGFPGRLGGAPDLSQDAYRQHLATALYRSQADIPSYDQWVQQRSAPKPMPQVFPQKPGVPGFGLSTAMQPYFQELAQQAVQQPLVSLPRPQVFPQKPGLSTTMQPRPQVSPPNPGLGLAGLANMLRGRQ